MFQLSAPRVDRSQGDPRLLTARQKQLIRLKRYLPLMVMTIPAIVYLICNNYLPMFGLTLAFKKFNYKLGVFGSPWCGFDNFKFLFSGNDTARIFRNTICYNIWFLALGTVLAITIAIILNEITKKKLQQVYQTIILIPYLMSWVIISYIAFAFLSNSNGFINNTLLPLLGVKPVNWYTSAKEWPAILTVVFMWKQFGYQSIIYFATILGIDRSYYEAAVVDGATTWQQITKITLPCLKPTVITLTIMYIGRIFSSDFGLFYQVPQNSGLLYATTQTIDTYVYRALLELNDVGRATAAGFLQSVLGFATVMLVNLIVRKVDKEMALF